ncbi:protein involved in sex pheromone biosynthesis [Staphylococcus hominis]
MKKELLIGMVGTTLLLGACGNSTENSDNEKNKDAKKVEEKKK